MGIGYSGDDVIIKIGMDMKDLKSDLNELQSMITKSFEKMESEAAENASQMENKFDKAFEGMEREAKESSGQVIKQLDGIKGFIKGGFSRVLSGVSGMIAGAFTLNSIKNFGVSIVEAAADLEAMEAAFEQVFVTSSGDFTDEATKNIKDMCKEWDMEVNTLKGDYSAFAAQFKGLGMEMGDAMDYSNTSMKLAADAAAMFNIPMDEAIEHVRSFVKGNYIGGESIQLFGSQAMLASYAVEQGIIKEEAAFKELTEAQKQMIRLDFAQHQYDLAGTTGQAAREADMYANQLTKVKQKWTDFKAQLGEKAMEGAVNIFKGLSDALEKIDTDKIGAFFGDLLGMLGEGFGAGLEAFTGWINSVNWEWFGIQLEEIAGLLKDFGGGAIDGIKEVLDPVAEGFLGVWDSLMGVDDINTDNMDSTNLALVRIKPVLKWFADNGEAVGKGITAVTLAVAGWKTLNFLLDITVGLGKNIGEIASKGFWAWLCSKSNVFKNLNQLGKWTKGAVGGAARAASGGSVLATGAFTLAAVFTVLAIWQWQDENDPEVKEKAEGRVKAKSSGQLSPDKKLNGGKNYDWKNSPITKAWNEFWKGTEETQRTTLETMNNNGTQFGIDFSNIWSEGWTLTANAQEIGAQTSSQNNENYWRGMSNTQRTQGTEMKNSNAALWNEITHSKWYTKTTGFLQKHNISWSGFKGFMGRTWDGITGACGRFWKSITESKFVTGVKQLCSNTKSSWSTWGSDIKKNWDGIKKEWSKFWKELSSSKFGQWMKSMFNGIIGYLNSGIRKFLKGMNSIIKGINWVYNKIAGKKLLGEIQIEKWTIPKLAKGTDNWGGGTALVGEAGRELVSDPKLGTFMADKPMLLPLSKGAAVLRNSKTEQLLKYMGIPAFKDGKSEGIFDSILDGFGTLWSYMSNPSKLWEKVMNKIGLDFGGNNIISGLKDGIKKLFKGNFIVEKIKKWFDDSIPDVGGIASVNAWKPYIVKAAAFFGDTLTNNEMQRVLQQIRTESGGSQTVRQSAAVNDENAKSGNWARGLLQYVPSTFDSYKVKGFGNIHNGYHQLLAFFNNSTWRKALPKLGEIRGWSPRGKRRKAANGILVDGATPLTVGEKGQEAVVPLSNARALKPFGQSVLNAIQEEANNSSGGGVYEFTIPVNIDGRQVAIATATFTKEELDKLEKRQDRRNGVR